MNKKSGRAMFYPFCPPSSCQVSEKIVGAVSAINSLRTNEHPDKAENIEPVAFAGSISMV